MKNNTSTYIVELREYTDSGDYIENDYDFDSKLEAMKFAYENKGDVYSILEYKANQNHDPRDITNQIN
tara:strand:- start:1883 stop:2086 length:204 start_codon:yes stop_codon:yes gene_type:complete